MAEKTLLQLDEQEIVRLSDRPETGMGYYVVTRRLSFETEDSMVVIAGDHFVVPLAHPEFFSLEDLIDGIPLPQHAARKVKLTASLFSRTIASLPPHYRPTAGAVPLLGSATVSAPTTFFRFVGPAIDPRFAGGPLAQDTYLTTSLDRTYANTGFAAVGRYALPLPSPASHVFEYELPAGTTIQVGTVLPNYGQAGGGVEIKLPARQAAVQRGPHIIDDL